MIWRPRWWSRRLLGKLSKIAYWLCLEYWINWTFDAISSQIRISRPRFLFVTQEFFHGFSEQLYSAVYVVWLVNTNKQTQILVLWCKKNFMSFWNNCINDLACQLEAQFFGFQSLWSYFTKQCCRGTVSVPPLIGSCYFEMGLAKKNGLLKYFTWPFMCWYPGFQLQCFFFTGVD